MVAPLERAPTARTKGIPALLERLTAVAYDHVARNHGDIIRGRAQALRADAEKETDSRTAGRQMQLAMLLDQKEAALRLAHLAALRETLVKECATQLMPEVSLETEPAAGELALVDTAVQDRRVRADRAASPILNTVEESSTFVIRRICAGLKQPMRDGILNPFRPYTFVQALSQGWANSGLDPYAEELLISAVTPKSFIKFEALYDELQDALTRAGVPQDPGYQVRAAKQAAQRAAEQRVAAGESSTAAPKAGPDDERAEQLHSEVSAEHDPEVQPSPASAKVRSRLRPEYRAKVARALQQLVTLGLKDGSGAQQGAVDPELMETLTLTQARMLIETRDSDKYRNVLTELSRSPEFKRAPAVDRLTAAALAEVFDEVFEDRVIPSPLKPLIGQAQIPVLKSAMLDRRFFSHKEHPGRQLLENMVSVAAGWRPEFGKQDASYLFLKAVGKDLLSGVIDNLLTFETINEKFTKLKAAKERLIEYELKPYLSELETNEKLELALHAADECLHARLKWREPAPFMIPFLLTRWRLALAFAFSRRGEDLQRWKDMVAITEGLIWSVEPKHKEEDRAKLVASLPKLAASVSAVLDQVGWKGTDRDAFMQRLMRTHADLAFGGNKQPEDERQKQQDMINAHAEIEALRARRRSVFEGGDNPYLEEARNYRPGSWFDFVADNGTNHRYRVSQISPRRTRIVFSWHNGKEAFVRKDAELARQIAHGQVHGLDANRMVTKAISQLLGSESAQTVEVAAPSDAAAGAHSSSQDFADTASGPFAHTMPAPDAQ
ncbi:MAG TPA: DUF1631 family protein [Burkholderiaceae bacterium]|nr:DUF1631 family protein [Burkholderiaceae bacterium]